MVSYDHKHDMFSYTSVGTSYGNDRHYWQVRFGGYDTRLRKCWCEIVSISEYTPGIGALAKAKLVEAAFTRLTDLQEELGLGVSDVVIRR